MLRRGSGHLVSIIAGYQVNRRQEYSSPHSHGYEPVPEGDLELDFKLQTLTLNVDHQIKTSERNHISFGLNSEGQHNTIAGYSFLLPEFDQVTAGVYFSDKYYFNENLMVNGGIRFDYGFIDIKEFIDPYIEFYLKDSAEAAKYKVRSPAIRSSVADITYAGGVVYSLNSFSDIKVNLGKSYRMPTANELSSNGIHHGTFRHEMGDSTLKSEKSYQFDATYDYQIKNSSIVVGGFVNYFPNFIFLNPSGEFSFLPDAGQIYKYVQSTAFRTGGELQFKTELFNRLDINIAAEYVFAIDLENHYPIPFTPPLNIVSEIGYHFKNTEYFKNSILTSTFQLVTAQNQVARNELSTPGYSLLGIALSTDLILKSHLMQVSFRIDNIFDTKYYNHLSFYRPLDLPEAGRNFQLTMKIPIIKQAK
jgi:iron complex outermembrane receptor protein